MTDQSLATEDDIAMLRSLMKHGRTDLVTEPEEISMDDVNFAYFFLEGLVLSPNDLLQILKCGRSISKVNFGYIVDALIGPAGKAPGTGW
jgi:hypothetical protein